ncbi:MAG: nucleoside triphosphate pyrophosphohydrolase family protein [Patescibacteria group bacterium]|jgi:NTP pyrophosphatase (non-canonical NTP hydrolase)
MTPKEYIENAKRTESKPYAFPAFRDLSPRIEHAVYGIVTEAGELMSAVKKTKIYEKPLDKINLVEEAGDVMWYLAILADELGVSFEDIWDKNIRKLKTRYPDKYDHEMNINRQTDKERKELES